MIATAMISTAPSTPQPPGLGGGGMGWNGVVSPSALDRSNGLKLEVVLDCDATAFGMMTVVPAGIWPSGSVSELLWAIRYQRLPSPKTRDAMMRGVSPDSATMVPGVLAGY